MQSDSVHLGNQSAGTTSPFGLQGGRYVIAVAGTFSSSTVKLKMQAGDGTTFVSIFAAFNNAGTEADLEIGSWSANGAKIIDLPAGQYEFVLSSGQSATYITVSRVPLD